MKRFFIYFICLMLFFGVCHLWRDTRKETIIATIKHKECTGMDTYKVYCNNETFKITDSVVLGRWNSSDFYGQLQVNKTYQFEVVGWRIPFFSEYRNIVKADLK